MEALPGVEALKLIRLVCQWRVRPQLASECKDWTKHVVPRMKENQTQVQHTPAPPNNDPDTSGEVQKARMAQALRAFLCLSLSENIRLNPEKIGTRLGTRYTVVH